MLGFSVNPEGSKRVFIRSYCTKRGGEEKRRGQNTELGGSDPTFRPFGLESDPWVAPAHRRNMQRRVFWPPRHRARKEKGTRREEGESECNDSSSLNGKSNLFLPRLESHTALGMDLRRKPACEPANCAD